MGRVLTEAPHGIRAEDLAGPLRPEVVTGNIFTVAPTEHQLVAVFFLLRLPILMGQDLLFVHFLPGASAGLVGWGCRERHCPLWCTLYRP